METPQSNETEEKEGTLISKPHIFLLDGKWCCYRWWDQKREYRSFAPSWKLLYILKEERWQGTKDHNLFIQDDVREGWKEFCIETWYYPFMDREGQVLFAMWYSTPPRCGLSSFVH